MIQKLHRRLPPLHFGVFLAALLVAGGIAHAAAAEPLPAEVFAVVDGQTITGTEYLAVLRSQARQKFYHGQAPEAELAAFRREVGADLILRVLHAREAERRGVQADESEVARQLAALERRYAQSPQWEEHKERFLREVAPHFRTNSRIARLEAQLRDVPAPNEAQLEAYYRQHPDQFTTPERIRVAVILRRVPPSASDEQWQQALREAETLAGKLAAGAAFSELARLHSQDASADDGGDMGFVHRTMLGEAAQAAIDRLSLGQTSPPVRLLEGYSLFRLDGREPARLNPLAGVRERAVGLWEREAQDDAWRAFGARLRAAARVRVNETYYVVPAQEISDRAGQRKSRP